jgi:hypothetical protein
MIANEDAHKHNGQVINRFTWHVNYLIIFDFSIFLTQFQCPHYDGIMMGCILHLVCRILWHGSSVVLCTFCLCHNVLGGGLAVHAHKS